MTHTNQNRRQDAWMWPLAALVGTVVLLVAFESFRSRSGWTDAELWATRAALANAALVFATLIAIWKYTSTTNELLNESREQTRHSLALRKSASTPIVVTERREDQHGGFHYYLSNVGAGVAINVWIAQPSPYPANRETLNADPIGPLAPGASRMLPGFVEGNLCNRVDDHGTLSHCLLAQGVSEEVPWTATLNIRGRTSGSEIQTLWLELEPIPFGDTRPPREVIESWKVKILNDLAAAFVARGPR